MATKTDIAKDVLKHVGILDASETPSAADDADVKKVIDGYHAQLLNDGIAYWPNDDYPEHVRFPFVRYVAPTVARMFDRPMQETQDYRADARAAYKDLVSQTRMVDETGLPTRADYY
jgi:hypothetical protein